MNTNLTKFSSFANVDRSANPNYFVHYLDTVSSMEAVQAYKRQTYSSLEVTQGEHILDVGCGIGSDVQALAKIVGSNGLVVGVDSSETMIQEAQKRSQELDLVVKYQQGDIYNLEFPDNTFDACRADRLFHFLDNPTKALDEMLRVTRPGGRVVISEPDWQTLVVDHIDSLLTHKILNHKNLSCIGRKLPALFRKAHLQEIVVIPVTIILTDFALASQIFHLLEIYKKAIYMNIVSTNEVAEWLTSLMRANQENLFFSSLTGFIVSGKKPFH